MLNKLTYSKDGLLLTQQFESCRTTSYQDQVGVWTIGYGHTGPDVCEGMSISKDQALGLLARDIQTRVDFVNARVQPQLSQGEFDALVDFAFNLGNGAELHSTLLEKVNAGDFAGAADEFVKWDKAGGVEVVGLLRRRLAEKEEFLLH